MSYRNDVYRSMKRRIDEIQSPAFVSGVAAAIEHTRKTGLETGFNVRYDPRVRMFIYPDQISVGTETSLHPKRKEFTDFEEQYFKETGERYSEREFSERLHKPTNGEFFISDEFSELHKRKGAFFEWLKATGRALIDFPYTEGKESKDVNAYLLYLHSKSLHPLFDNMLFFHTHPHGYTFPSPNDLRYLNNGRRINERKRSNPVGIIASCSEQTRGSIFFQGYPVILFQERSREPLPEDTNFDAMSCGIALYAPSREERLVRAAFNVPAPATEPETTQALKNYKILEGNLGNMEGKNFIYIR